MTVYLDNCCFNRPFDDQSQLRIHLESEAKLEIQQQIRAGALQLIWSYILEFENDENPFDERKERISEWRGMAAIKVKSSERIFTHAQSLQELGIKNKDSLHVACAIAGGADRFFTTDDRLINKKAFIPELKIENPVDFTINESSND